MHTKFFDFADFSKNLMCFYKNILLVTKFVVKEGVLIY